MIALLGALRREMNGAVVGSMHLYGRSYGLNYGVSLPTIRAIARAERCDHDFARYLYRQQVRELRLAALYIADPEAIDTEQIPFWAEGIINNEIAEEAAFALLHRPPAVQRIFGAWAASDNELLAYSALMAAARGMADDAHAVAALPAAVAAHPSSHFVARGAVALLAAAYETCGMYHVVAEALQALAAMPPSSASRYIAEEMSWRTAAAE